MDKDVIGSSNFDLCRAMVIKLKYIICLKSVKVKLPQTTIASITALIVLCQKKKYFF